jgi:hypothetical protein
MQPKAPTQWNWWACGLLSGFGMAGVINQASHQRWLEAVMCLVLVAATNFGLWYAIRRSQQPEQARGPWYRFRF